MNHVELASVAMSYAAHGLCPLPAFREHKRPALSWKPFQFAIPESARIASLFDGSYALPGVFADARRPDALCILSGAVSGNLEVMDFDHKAEYLADWMNLVDEEQRGLAQRLVIEKSQSGGAHVIYRVDAHVPGSLKLASRRHYVDGPGSHGINGKPFVARLDPASQRWFVPITLIETKGEGGLILCAPSPGYKIISVNGLDAIPTITAREREILIECARGMNEHLEISEPAISTSPPATNQREGAGGHPTELRPGDDFNARGDLRPALIEAGWTLALPGPNEKWRRPGKTEGGGWSATYNSEVFYVFSSSAAPFEPDKGYSKFNAYALLAHEGDHAAAARALSRQGFGVKPEKPPMLPPIQPLAPGASVQQVQKPVVAPNAPASADIAPDPVGPFPRPLIDLPLPDQNDGMTLLGNRWLCRGGVALLVGQTGMGKSSFICQAIMSWALGHPFAGIEPVHPLRSLLVQAENDDGDMAEIADGVKRGLALSPGDVTIVKDRVLAVNEIGSAGTKFAHRLCALLDAAPNTDLLVIDPAFAYLEGDANRNECVGAFMRQIIMPVAARYLCGVIVVHHTNKPLQGEQKSTWSGGDFAYLGAGAAEWANAARAVLAVRSIGSDTIFELKAAKRGKRIGWADDQGAPTTTRHIAHSAGSIFWRTPEQDEIDAVLEKGNDRGAGRRAKTSDSMIRVVMAQLGGVADYNALCKAVMDASGCSIATAKRTVTKARAEDVLTLTIDGKYRVK